MESPTGTLTVMRIKRLRGSIDSVNLVGERWMDALNDLAVYL